MRIFQMSLSASVLILLIILVRPAVKTRIPGNVLLLLWAIVCCKLMLPSRFFFPDGFMGRIWKMAAVSGEAPGQGEGLPYIPAVPAGIRVITESVPKAGTEIWQIVWLTGMLCLVLYFVYTYIRCISVFRQALPPDEGFSAGWRPYGNGMRRKVEIRVSDRIYSPLTYGIVRPVILLPKKMVWKDGQGLDYILEHELAHIRRWDCLWKIGLASVLACHWFNPFVWGMYFLANRDIELACDEKVIRTIGNKKRASYAEILLEWEARKSEVNLLASCFMQHFMKERITNIMKKKKKLTIAGIVLSLVLIAGAIVVYAATPAEEKAAARESEKETGQSVEVAVSEDAVTVTRDTGEDIETDNTGAAENDIPVWMEDPTLGGIFELYTPEEYEKVVENVKKYADGEGGDNDETVKRMEADLEKLKADNGKGEFIIYKPAFEESYTEDGISYHTGLNPMSIMAPELEWRPESSPLTAEVYEEEAERMKSVFDRAVENGMLTEEQRQRILDVIDDNIERLKAKQ